MDIDPTSLPERSRLKTLTRRRFLHSSAIGGLAVAIPGLACGNSDADVFAGAESTTTEPTASSATSSTTASSSTTSSTAASSSTAPSSTAASSTEPESTTSTAADAGGSAGGELGPMEVAFTYTMGAGGKQLKPYVAVWVESTDGELLRTVALWYEQTSKGPRWLNDLTQWWRIDQARIGSGGQDQASAISSATRAPGAYSVLWDGANDQGQPVLDDDVVICIESARERGPYSLICETVSRSSLDSAINLPDDEELSGASIGPA